MGEVLAVVPTAAPEPIWYRVMLRRKRERLLCVADRAELDAEIRKLGADRVIAVDLVRTHECAVCQKRAPWSDGWAWFGSYADLDDGAPVIKACSDACMAQAKRLGLVPKNAGVLEDA